MPLEIYEFYDFTGKTVLLRRIQFVLRRVFLVEGICLLRLGFPLRGGVFIG